ncbi:hypothetical protein BASA82_000278 [Batrachochytrium salamandrivorans]|nr:hypothetical protein BASA82_000278 [Batrachochytrium salamandrivorans]
MCTQTGRSDSPTAWGSSSQTSRGGLHNTASVSFQSARGPPPCETALLPGSNCQSHREQFGKVGISRRVNFWIDSLRKLMGRVVAMLGSSKCHTMPRSSSGTPWNDRNRSRREIHVNPCAMSSMKSSGPANASVVVLVDAIWFW